MIPGVASGHWDPVTQPCHPFVLDRMGSSGHPATALAYRGLAHLAQLSLQGAPPPSPLTLVSAGGTLSQSISLDPFKKSGVSISELHLFLFLIYFLLKYN